MWWAVSRTDNATQLTSRSGCLTCATMSTGLAQRLVSYHLTKLEGAELVRAGEGRPRPYEAAPALADPLT